MKKTTVLFDLDGTLLPMNQDLFLKEYFKGLTAILVKEGFDKEVSFNAVMKGIKAMVLNDGSATNEAVFWREFTKAISYDFSNKMSIFENYYSGDFEKSKALCGYNPAAKKAVNLVKELGMRPVLATNPVCPIDATYRRITWAGLEVSDFELITTYDNSSYSKPNPLYYTEIMNKLGVTAEQCLMVGNDTSDDLSATEVGIPVFFLTDCLINKNTVDISKYPNGSFGELMSFLNTINKES